MIGAKEIQEFENSLASFLETGGMDLLKWFMTIDITNKAVLLHSETIVNKFWSTFVRNGPHDVEIFQYLVTGTPAETRELLGDLFSSLIATKDPNKYNTLLGIFKDKHKEWPKEITMSLQKACIKTASETGFPQNGQLLEAVLNSLSSPSYEELESIATSIIPLITHDEVNLRNEGIRLLKLANEKVGRGKPFGIQECIDKTKLLLTTNNENAKPLLDYLFRYLDKLTAKQQTQLTDLIQEQLIVSKPNQIRLLALEFVSILISELGRRNLLQDVLELAKTVQEIDAKERCKYILRKFKPNLSLKQEKETKALFGDAVFD